MPYLESKPGTFGVAVGSPNHYTAWSAIFKEEILSLNPNNLHCVKVHRDNAPIHPSKWTVQFFKKIINETGIETIPFKCIPTESADVSPMNYSYTDI